MVAMRLIRGLGELAATGAVGSVALIVLLAASAGGSAHLSPSASEGLASAPLTQKSTNAQRTPSAAQADSIGGWTYLGPDDIGVPTSAISTSRVDSGFVLTATDLGAVFKSVDGGDNWTFVVQLPFASPRFEQDANDPATWYAWSGSDYLALQDVMQTHDNGAHWTRLGVANDSLVRGYVLTGRATQIRSVAQTPGLLFATLPSASGSGLIRSADGGAHWTEVGNYLTPGSSCGDVIAVAARGRVIASCGGTVVSAPLNGSTVTVLNNVHADDFAKLKIAVAPSNPDVIYAASTYWNDGGGGSRINRIYRSIDGGNAWEIRFDRPATTNPFNIALPADFDKGCDGIHSDGYQVFQLAVDPLNQETLWVGGREIYRSDDGGRTMGRASLLDGIGESAISFSPTYSVDSTLYAAGPSGLMRTLNARQAVQTYPSSTCKGTNNPAPAVAWTTLHHGLSTGRVLDGEADGNGALFAAVLERGTYMGSEGSPSWALLDASVGRVVLPSLGGVDRLLLASDPYAYRLDRSGGSWTKTFATMGYSNTLGYVYSAHDNEVGRGASFPHPAQNPSRPSQLAVVSQYGVNRSDDAGVTWRRTSTVTNATRVIFRADGRLLMVRSGGTLLMETAPDSDSWTERDLTGCLITSGTCNGDRPAIDDLVASPVAGSTDVYAVTSKSDVSSDTPGIYRSADGVTWTPLAGVERDLPHGRSSMRLAVDPDNSAWLYAGTGRGVFASQDGGATWVPYATPFGPIPVSQLVVRKSATGQRLLYVFTVGRGAWSQWLPYSTLFADVPANHWAYDYIGRLFAAGITSGCGTSPLIYCPDQTVTRDQMAVFLIRAVHGQSYTPPAAAGVFADVPSTNWAASWIEQLARDGVTTGCSVQPALYCPAATLTRDQLAVFLLRAKHGAGYQPPAASGVFQDVSADFWAAPWIEQLAREGVTSGCSAQPKLFCPSGAVTRDQMAVFLVRNFNL
ncbi:S-layer homology domain-containing protein [Lysobacter claricitrinus]|uniref:S-layer homology domain-containing protein n=1 Tax=Lysobacter claricitrinus TaxID=3367728 RepID=UPI0037DBCFBD